MRKILQAAIICLLTKNLLSNATALTDFDKLLKKFYRLRAEKIIRKKFKDKNEQ
jgi:hypothetical protein